MITLRENEKRAALAVTMLWVMLGLEILIGVSSYLQYSLLNQMSNGIEVADATLDANDMRESIIGIIFLIAYITTGVLFIQWFRRAYYNLHQLVSYLNHTEGWAAGAWFVPFLNLIRPYQIMRELYDETHLILSKNQVAPFYTASGNNIAGVWWVLWIIVGIFDNVSTRMAFRAETIDSLLMTSWLSIISAALSVPLALLAIKVVKDYSKMETALHQLVRDGKIEGQINAGGNIAMEDNDILDAPIQ